MEKRKIEKLKHPSISDAINDLLINETKTEITEFNQKKHDKAVLEYSEKLKHPKWQRKRLEIMQRDNFECKCCFATEKELHVHHFNYGSEPWAVEDFELITLCKNCHDMFHDISKYDYYLVNNIAQLYFNFMRKKI